MLWAGYGYKDREIVTRRILAKVENDRKSNVLEGRPYYRSYLTPYTVIKKIAQLKAKGYLVTLNVERKISSMRQYVVDVETARLMQESSLMRLLTMYI